DKEVVPSFVCSCHCQVAEISDERSWVKVLVIPTDEARMIATETIQALGYEDMAEGHRGPRTKGDTH
ncbi:MAG: hypothetical protein ACUVXD_08775, partial [Thermodesulfobacteriota bacterium]